MLVAELLLPVLVVRISIPTASPIRYACEPEEIITNKNNNIIFRRRLLKSAA
jgi:hypothetical protein